MEGLIFEILRYVTGETLNCSPHIHPQGISFQPERRFNELQELFTVIPDRETILINNIVFRRKLKQHGKQLTKIKLAVQGIVVLTKTVLHNPRSICG